MKAPYKTTPEQRGRAAAWYVRNRERIATARAVYRVELLTRYGGACECCGEAGLPFLTLDHLNGGGNAEKRAIGRYGNGFLRWLLGQPKRPDLRVLCWNCNMARGLYGACPHEERRDG